MHEQVYSLLRSDQCSSLRDSARILLCRTTAFLRGAGGFSKSSKPFSYTNYSTGKVSSVKIPQSQPFAVFEDTTQPSQACFVDFSFAGSGTL